MSPPESSVLRRDLFRRDFSRHTVTFRVTTAEKAR